MLAANFLDQDNLSISMSNDPEMGWMPLSSDGIAMCQTRGVEAQAEGESIHVGGYHHRRRSGKERVPGSWRGGERVGSGVSGPKACPPVVEYSRQFQAQAAVELGLLLDWPAIVETLSGHAETGE